MSVITILDTPGGEGDPGDVLFATALEVAARMGRTFTEAETDQANMLLAMVSQMVAAELGKDATWPSTLTVVPPILRLVAIESVTRVLTNPSGARSESEQLGAYSHTTSYASDGPPAFSLTAWEISLINQAVFGTGNGSAIVPSIMDRLEDDGYYSSLDITWDGTTSPS